MKWLPLSLIKKTVVITIIGTMIFFGIHYWLKSKSIVSTDDAYINANVIQIAPRITGQVTHLNITNNQYVKNAEILFSLDREPFELAVNEAAAKKEKDQALLHMAELTAQRMAQLVQHKVASRQTGDTAEADKRSAIAELQLAETSLKRAVLNLQYTDVHAPTSGWVTNVTVRTGSIVEQNHPVFALISDQEFWVDANFKETELKSIKLGQKAKIHIDMYPRHEFTGFVESISGGTGTVFSLLPPQNATGNWVKVTQRIPVRIRVVNVDPKYPLRIGSSATVSLHIG
ncbi:MAG TPA: HlyD family secretion protein [Gammaproteobacteria bacterium]|jgi:membrane fusion protein (multidrug efflux system)|nr:HlyD family secretion protein [Gammaproteobacteria bacterium]